MISFEHSPPQSAGNNRKIVIAPFEEWFTEAKWTGKGRQQQKGSGGHTLCSDCNSRAGTLYVPEYKRWASTFLGVMHERGAEDGLDVDLIAVRPAPFMKQVVTMLLCACSPEFAGNHRVLADYVNEQEACVLPDRYQFYLTFIAGEHARFIGDGNATIDFTTGEVDVLIEAAFPPFAFLMTIDSPPRPSLGANITALVSHGFDEVTDLRIVAAIGEVYTPYAGDYRRKRELPSQQ